MNLKDESRVAVAVLTVAVVSLYFRRALFAHRPALIAAQVLAALLMLWARLTLGRRSFHGAANPTEGGLVTSGPYHFLRHPIYAAILLFLWAGVASHAAIVDLVLAIVASAATLVRIRSEERLVGERYPEYQAYAAHTKRLIPFVL